MHLIFRKKSTDAMENFKITYEEAWQGPDRRVVRLSSRFSKKKEFRRYIGTRLKNTLVHRPSFEG